MALKGCQQRQLLLEEIDHLNPRILYASGSFSGDGRQSMERADPELYGGILIMRRFSSRLVFDYVLWNMFLGSIKLAKAELEDIIMFKRDFHSLDGGKPESFIDNPQDMFCMSILVKRGCQQDEVLG
ncbi:hypothetical protein C8J56DRAFT_890765 [Mycena floridula]|nr:hypothetical protein C8J56DRAFT_890765 [Mycena floridula]